MSVHDPLAGRQILILSSVEWDSAWQRHQIFAVQWAAAGHQVFFVENTGFRLPGLQDAGRVGRKLAGLARGRHKTAQPIPEGIHVINPAVLPPTGRALRRVNSSLLLPRLSAKLAHLGLRPGAVAVAYLPTATTLALLDLMKPAVTVYDCVDNFHGHPLKPKDLVKTEGELMRRSALVTTTSTTLRDDKKPHHSNVLQFHHGVASDFFLGGTPRPYYRRFCYFGTLRGEIDYAPIIALAEAGFSVELIGPVKHAPPALPKTVRLRGAVSPQELARALTAFDALLLPYVNDEYNRGIIPAKIYECLATGKPVLSSPLPALFDLHKHLYVCRTPEEWVRTARALPDEENPVRRAARVEQAAAHTHEKAFSRLQASIRDVWPGQRDADGAAQKEPVWRKRLVNAFGWIGLGYGASRLLTLLTQVAAGRWLGPSEYGMANLVVASAAYIQVLPMLGFPLALSKMIPEQADARGRGSLITTSFAAFTLWASACLSIFLFGRAWLCAATSTSALAFDLSVGLAFATAAYTVFASPLLGLKRFDRRGVIELIYGASVPLLFIGFVMAHKNPAFSDLIWPLCLSLAISSLAALFFLRGELRSRIDPARLRPMLRYSLVAGLNLLAVASIQSPARLMLNHINSAVSVGIFSAYFTLSVQVSLALLQMLTSVLVPLASLPAGQAEAWSLFRRNSPRVFAASWALFGAAVWIGIRLFGNQYPLTATWAGLFALAAALILLQGAAGALLSARDFRGLCASVGGSLLAGTANIALCAVLIPHHHITGGACALIGAYSASLLFYACFIAYERRAA